MKKFIVALITALMLTACGVSVEAGNVADKRMEEAHVEQVEITERDCDWKNKTSTKTVNGKSKTVTKRVKECHMEGTGEFEEVEHEAKYFVTLEDKDGNDEEHEVTAEEYESLNKGDFFDTTK